MLYNTLQYAAIYPQSSSFHVASVVLPTCSQEEIVICFANIMPMLVSLTLTMLH